MSILNLSEELEIISDIKNIMRTVGIEYMPTVPIVKEISKGLNARITRIGGRKYLSNKYNIPLKQKGNSRVTTDEEIIEEINKVVSVLNLDRFPTRDEMNKVTKSHSLAGLISKRGGYVKWANKLNLKMKQSETLTGYYGEDLLKEIISSKGYKIERQTANCLYDFLINDYIRVDCKLSHLYHGKIGSFYSFNLENPMHDCDLFIFICEDDDKKRRVVIVPQSVLQHQKQVSIGEVNSKWHKYIDRYDFIDKYDEFYKTINYNI